MKLRPEDLWVTQVGLRDLDQLHNMVTFVEGGGTFSSENLLDPGPLIRIVRFEDGRLFIGDGHHRVAALYICGKSLLSNEYDVHNMKYESFNSINLDAGWVTPIDPLQEVRVSDCASFKEEVRQALRVSEATAINLIRESRRRYALPRGNLMTVHDLLASSEVPSNLLESRGR